MVQVSLLITPPPPCSSLYPYTTLFRSVLGADAGVVQPGGDGVGGNGLPVLVLHHEGAGAVQDPGGDRKSTRLNSSHVAISYAVFCLKKKIIKHFSICFFI